MLHSASGSYYGEQGAANYRIIEEASVEYLTREICREKRMQYAGGYEAYVDVLDQLSEYLGYKKAAFAKTLYNKHLPDRYDWLEEQVRKKLESDNAPAADYNDVINYCRNLQGGS